VKKAVLITLAGLLLSFSYVAVSASAGTPDYLKVNYPVVASYEPFTEPPSPTPEDNAGECWDCPGSKWQAERPRSYYCSPEALIAHPQHLDLCFPEKWAWVCFTEDPARNIKEHCAMYRRDLDPLGIFATPAPMPTPEPLPTPVPTATPDSTPVPDPETPATATPLPTELP
jgi:hypothetical protein